MKYEIQDVRIQKPIGADYSYIENHISHEDSVWGFGIQITAQEVLAAPVTVNVILGFDKDSLVPATEVASNTVYDVNGGAVGTRYLGDLTFDFSVQVKNVLWITPGMVLGGLTFPDPLPPIVGLRFVNSDLRIVDCRVTKRLGN